MILNIASDLAVIAPDQRLYRREGIAGGSAARKACHLFGSQDRADRIDAIPCHLLGRLRSPRKRDFARRSVQRAAEGFVARLSQLIPMGRMAQVDEYQGRDRLPLFRRLVLHDRRRTSSLTAGELAGEFPSQSTVFARGQDGLFSPAPRVSWAASSPVRFWPTAPASSRLGRSDRLEQEAAQWAAEFGSNRVRTCRVDMHDRDALERTFDEIVAAEPFVEILVNNAHELGRSTGFNTLRKDRWKMRRRNS